MQKLSLTIQQDIGLSLVGPQWEQDQTCDRCGLASGCKNPRAQPTRRVYGDKTGPTLYVIGDAPSFTEDASGQSAMAGARTQWLLRCLEGAWNGPVVFDYGLRCPTGDAKVATLHKNIAACAPHTAHILDAAAPAAVLALGAVAHYAVLGRWVDPESLTDAMCWLPGWECPVLPLPGLNELVTNRVHRGMVEQHIKEFLTNLSDKRAEWLASQTYRATTFANVPETVDEALAQIVLHTAQDLFAYDCETFGRQHTNYHRVCSLALVSEASVTVLSAAMLREPRVIAALRDLFSSKAVKAASNGKFDVIALATLGIKVTGPVWDTQYVARLLNAEGLGGLEVQAERVGWGGHKSEMKAALKVAQATVANAQRKQLPLPGLGVHWPEAANWIPPAADDKDAWAYGLVPVDLLNRYNALDTCSTYFITRKQRRDLAGTPMQAVWDKVTSGTVTAFAAIESRGMPIDKGRLHSFITAATTQQQHALMELQARGLSNPGSPQQVGAWLLSQGVRSTGKTTAGGAMATSEDVLLPLAGKYPAVQLILDYRGLDKLRGTYGQGIMDRLGSDGCIHTGYKIDGAGTGRLSSVDPNLQNIPRPETDLAKLLRSAFVADHLSRPGWCLLQADYSQLEIKVAAMVCGDPAMILAVNDANVDFHTSTARKIAQMAWREDWTTWTTDKAKIRRSAAKGVVFGILYGKTAWALSHDLGVSEKAAQAVMDGVFGAFPLLKDAVDRYTRDAERTGYTWTMLDGVPARRRPLIGIGSPIKGVATNARNAAWNTPVQGSGADFCTRSCVELENNLEPAGYESRLIGTVHDSIMFRARVDELSELVPLVKHTMEGWPSGAVRLAVDFETGPDWCSLKKYDPAARYAA